MGTIAILENGSTFLPGDNPIYASGQFGGGNTQLPGASQDSGAEGYSRRSEEERYLDNPIYSTDTVLCNPDTPYMVLDSSSSIYDTAADDNDSTTCADQLIPELN